MTKKILKWLVVLAFVGAVLGLGGIAGIFWWYGRDLPRLLERDDFDPPQMTRFYSAEGEVIAEYFTPGSKRTVVPLEKIPDHVRYAFMAAEDADFMRHEGIDYLGLVRAFYYAVMYDTGIKGTSTITQQVVKNLILTPEKAIERKVKEIILARQIEEHLTKEDILYLYLNTIYLGHGVNGVEEAARHYFGKSVSELNLPEAATLAGLTQSPESKTPFRHPERAAKRRAFVLKQMWEKGFIEEAAYRKAQGVEPKLADRARSYPYIWSAPYFTEHVRKTLADRFGKQRLDEEGPQHVEAMRDLLVKKYGGNAEKLAEMSTDKVREQLIEAYGDEELRGGGLKVHTTLQVKRQEEAEEAVRTQIAQYDDRKKYYRPQKKLTDEAIGKFIEKQAAEVAKRGLKRHAFYDAVVTSVDTDTETVRIKVGNEDGVLLLEPKLRIFGGKQCTEETLRETLMRGHVLKVQVASLAAEGGEPMKARFVPGPQMALVSIDPTNRHVVAMVGGYDYDSNKYNHATQAHRQTGSTFKPFVYGAALEKKLITPASIFLDSPAVFKMHGGTTWAPKNSDGTWRGPIRIREGLGASRNVIAVRVLKEVGIEPAMEFAHRVGIHSELTDNYTMVMGSSELTPLEITNAYATFASGGLVAEPLFVTKIETRSGTEEFRPEFRRVITEQLAYLISFLMTSVVHGYTDSHGRRRGGTAPEVSKLGHKVAGKTGTTNEAKDAWFIGFTKDLVTGVWVGFQDNHSLGAKEYGGRVAAPIWLAYMKAALDGKEPTDFVPPAEGLQQAMIDPTTGKLAREGGIEETFLEGTAPTEYAPTSTEGDNGSENNFLLNQFGE